MFADETSHVSGDCYSCHLCQNYYTTLLELFFLFVCHLHLAISLKQRWPEGCLELVTIIFSRAWFGDNGRIEHGQWTQMRFDGRSLTELGNEIANRLGVQFENVTLCVQAGDLGRPVPLLTDLPLRDDPTIILAFMVDSPGENHIDALMIELRFGKFSETYDAYKGIEKLNTI